MTCEQLGGACDKQFQSETFGEIGELSRKHAMEMAKRKDPDHLKAMEEMRDLMQDPNSMKEWMEEKKKEFDTLPEDK